MPSIDKEFKSHASQENGHIRKKNLKTNTLMIENIVKLAIIDIPKVNILHIAYVI